MNPLLSNRWLEPCGNKLLERLLPWEKFGNMESDAVRLFGCVRRLSIC
jgi:hypothetical protein